MRNKFTLIELLVVIVIIAILLSMLMPALGRAKHKVKLATCLSNVRQLGIAVQLYYKSNNNISQYQVFYTDYAAQPNATWSNVAKFKAAYEFPLEKYLGNSSGVLECPGDTGDRRWPVTRKSSFEFFRNSYYTERASGSHFNIDRFINLRSGKSPWPIPTSGSVRRLNDFDFPDNKVTFYKLGTRTDANWGGYSRNRWHGQKADDGRTVLGFMDGHVEFFDVWWLPTNSKPSLNADGAHIDRDGYY